MSNRLFLSKAPVHSLLSRKEVEKSNRGWDVDSPTFRHRAIMGLFGALDEGSRERAGILFRLDRVAGQAPYFLVQSKIEPDNVADVDGFEVREWSLPDLSPGTPVSFRASVNAVRRRTIDEGGKRKTRITPVPFDYDEAAVESGLVTITPWLEKKLEGALRDVQVTNHLRDVLEDPRGPGGRKALQVDTIDGVGLVDDPGALAELVRDGIGRERAYGCGLLSVKALT